MKQPRNMSALPGKKVTDLSQPQSLQNQQLFDLNLTMTNFKLDSILGTGSYATVRMSTDKITKQKYAIKIYEKSKLNDSQKMNNVKREISLLKRLEHPNIIKLFYAIEDKRSVIQKSIIKFDLDKLDP